MISRVARVKLQFQISFPALYLTSMHLSSNLVTVKPVELQLVHAIDREAGSAVNCGGWKGESFPSSQIIYKCQSHVMVSLTLNRPLLYLFLALE